MKKLISAVILAATMAAPVSARTLSDWSDEVYDESTHANSIVYGLVYGQMYREDCNINRDKISLGKQIKAAHRKVLGVDDEAWNKEMSLNDALMFYLTAYEAAYECGVFRE